RRGRIGGRRAAVLVFDDEAIIAGLGLQSSGVDQAIAGGEGRNGDHGGQRGRGRRGEGMHAHAVWIGTCGHGESPLACAVCGYQSQGPDSTPCGTDVIVLTPSESPEKEVGDAESVLSSTTGGSLSGVPCRFECDPARSRHLSS